MNSIVKIEQLAMHPEALPPLRHWFETEWPEYYGAGSPGDAQNDLQSFANHDRLPIGVVAFQDGELCGVAALKADSIASHSHLSPWAAAGLVKSSERGKGIGAQLIDALEKQARNLGFPLHLLRHEHGELTVGALRLGANGEHYSRGTSAWHLPQSALTIHQAEAASRLGLVQALAPAELARRA